MHRISTETIEEHYTTEDGRSVSQDPELCVRLLLASSPKQSFAAADRPMSITRQLHGVGVDAHFLQVFANLLHRQCRMQ